MQIQLDFFKSDEECERDQMRRDLQAMKQSNDKIRKALFARHGELMKMYLDVNERLTLLERNICKGMYE